MASFVGSLILVITIMFSFSLSSGNNYQFLVMVHQWGPALCRFSNINCIRTPAHDKFKVHGVWPANHSDPQPNYCKLSNQKDEFLDTTKFPTRLVNQLRTSWPSLTGMDEDFWKSEWRKHGTCSFHKFDQKQYFWLAVNFWQHMDLFDILGKDGIVPRPYQTPGKLYDQNGIIEAIKIHHFKGLAAFVPEFHCRGSELLEIRMCLDPDGIDYINCTRAGNCGQTFEWFI